MTITITKPTTTKSNLTTSHLLPPSSSSSSSATAAATLTTTNIQQTTTAPVSAPFPLTSTENNHKTQQNSTNQNQNQHHHSRLTRFLSKFTNSSIHSKRKSSLPNLNQQQQQAKIITNPSQTTSKRSLSQHLPNHSNDLNSTLKPNSKKLDSVLLQPLLPLPTISDRRSSSSDQILHLNQNVSAEDVVTDFEDGADPNASIRPLTPSSKAISIMSPNDTRTGITDLSSMDPTDQESPTYSRDSERRSSMRRRRKTSMNSSCSSEPDDCKSGSFGDKSSLASTKPTTVVSVDNPPGNRIAQPHHHLSTIQSTMAQPSLNLRSRVILSHQRVQSGSSNPNFPTPTPSLTLLASPPPAISPPQNQFSIVNVPYHSLPNPSQNPHPAALADNASILTLASSGFSPSLNTNQQFQSDEDASVRALAPSRRESIESLSSRWSNVKSNRSTRTTGTGTNFFTGINNHSNNLNSEYQPISLTKTTTPTATNENENEVKEDENDDASRRPNEELEVESINDDRLDHSDIHPTTDGVPSIALVNV